MHARSLSGVTPFALCFFFLSLSLQKPNVHLSRLNAPAARKCRQNERSFSLSLSLSLPVRFVEIARKRRRHWPRRRPTSSLHSSVGLEPSLSACVVRSWLHFTVGTRAYGFVTEKDRGKRKIVVASLHRSSKTRSLRIDNLDFVTLVSYHRVSLARRGERIGVSSFVVLLSREAPPVEARSRTRPNDVRVRARVRALCVARVWHVHKAHYVRIMHICTYMYPRYVCMDTIAQCVREVRSGTFPFEYKEGSASPFFVISKKRRKT